MNSFEVLPSETNKQENDEILTLNQTLRGDEDEQKEEDIRFSSTNFGSLLNGPNRKHTQASDRAQERFR